MNAFVIRNPISGSPQRQRMFVRAIRVLEEAGWRVQVRVTAYAGHARELAQQATREGWSVVVVAGGDGSIGQVADGMMRAGASTTSLGIIPMGTGNVFARAAGLPYPRHPGDEAPIRAARMIVNTPPVPVDVGRANGVHFLSWAGVGLDAQVTERVEAQSHFKRRAPVLFYGLQALGTLWRYQPSRMRLLLSDGEVVSGRFPLVVVANIGLYARYFRVSPPASLQDGLLDVLVFTQPSPAGVLVAAARLLIRPQGRVPGLVRRQARHLTLQAHPPQPYHLDGDPAGQTPLTVEILPRALKMHVPDPTRRQRHGESNQ